jgi:crotonobetainyl-CoA:carnitine CoA-transferase CaiB-like acyl-CoA transferase
MDDETHRFGVHLRGLGLLGWPHLEHRVRVRGADPVLPTGFRIGEAAAVALALGGLAAAELHRMRGAPPAEVTVDVGHACASLLGFALQVPADGVVNDVVGGTVGGDPVRTPAATTGFFAARGGRFIHLHGGFPALHRGTLELLGCGDGREAIAEAVAAHDAFALEDDLAAHGLCGAVVRTPAEWDAHAQAHTLRAMPVVSIERIADAPARPLPAAERPLAGIRVLDLTRVLAGPTSGRTLAQYGADVLRIGAPELPIIPPFFSETGHGKRAALLDLGLAEDRARLEALIAEADVFTDGFRPGSLEERGLGPAALARLRPGIVSVSLSCYGARGVFGQRRGWEQLAQSASGIAHIQGQGGEPTLVPAAATDYTTGYLAAWGVIEALRRRALEGGSWRVEVSLTRTAMWLRALGHELDRAMASGLPDLASVRMKSPGPDGDLLHVAPAVSLSTSPVRWDLPTPNPEGDLARWL